MLSHFRPLSPHAPHAVVSISLHVHASTPRLPPTPGSGSGIPDVKAFLNGVESPIFKNFFRIRTFVAKVGAAACWWAHMQLLHWCCTCGFHAVNRAAHAWPMQVVGSALAVSSSLVMGKEGPMLHAGSILAVVLGTKCVRQGLILLVACWYDSPQVNHNRTTALS